MCAKELVVRQFFTLTPETEIAEETLAFTEEDVGGLDVLVTEPFVVEGLGTQDDGAHDGPDLVDVEDCA